MDRRPAAPLQPLDYRPAPRPFVEDGPPHDLGSFTLRALGIITIVGLVVFLLPFGGIDDKHVVERMVTCGVIITSVGAAVFALGMVFRRWEKRAR